MLPSLVRALVALVPLVPVLAGCASMRQDLETVFIPDREEWVVANARDGGARRIVELVPKGQTLDAWRELCTVEAHERSTGFPPPAEAVRTLEARMRERGGAVEWNVIEESAGSVLYEWTLRGAPGHADQGEISRLVQGKDAVHRAAYAYKSVPLDPARRAAWIDLLRQARVVKGDQERRAAIDELMPEWRGKH